MVRTRSLCDTFFVCFRKQDNVECKIKLLLDLLLGLGRERQRKTERKKRETYSTIRKIYKHTYIIGSDYFLLNINVISM